MRSDESDVAHEINTDHTNRTYLPEASLPSALVATTDMADALAGVDCVVIGIPSRWIRAVLRDLRDHLDPGVPIVSLVKGLGAGTNLRMTEVVAAELPGHPVGALSGPNLAREVGWPPPRRPRPGAGPLRWSRLAPPHGSVVAERHLRAMDGVGRRHVAIDVAEGAVGQGSGPPSLELGGHPVEAVQQIGFVHRWAGRSKG